MAIIYSVDTTKPVTPEIARDALVQCFSEAHCMDAGLGEAPSDQNKNYCKEIIRQAFADTEGDFDQPTKQSLVRAITQLVTFSRAFRKPEIIEKHKVAIMTLVELLP